MNKRKRKLNKINIVNNTTGYLLCTYVRTGWEFFTAFTVGEKYPILKADGVGFVVKDNRGNIRGETYSIPLDGWLWKFSRHN